MDDKDLIIAGRMGVMRIFIKNNQPSSFILPLTLNCATDVTVYQSDLKRSFFHLLNIAAALMEKREAMLKAASAAGEAIEDESDFSSFVLQGHPKATIYIDAEDLARHEKAPSHLRPVHESMRELCSHSADLDRAKVIDRIRVPLSALNSVLKQLTEARFSLGYRDKHIMVIDGAIKNFTLKVGDKSYDLPLREQTAGQDDRQYILLPQVAEAGLYGLKVDDLIYRVHPNSLRPILSKTNRNLLLSGAGNLSLSLFEDKIYLFDFSQPSHKAAYERNCSIRHALYGTTGSLRAARATDPKLG